MIHQSYPYTVSSCENSPEEQVTLPKSRSHEQLNAFSPWSELEPVGSNQNSSVYSNVPELDGSDINDTCTENFAISDLKDKSFTNHRFLLDHPIPLQNYDCPYKLSIGNSFIHNQIPFHPIVLQCGVPTVTDYGAVTILLKHLIRVDMTCNGSVCVYNFPAMSVSALNATGNKCFVKHPNGRVFQNGPVVHMVTCNNRFAKITPKRLEFSSSMQGIAYSIDESGTKTTMGKFADLTRDMLMDIFFDGNGRSYDHLEQACYRMALEATYDNSPDGCEIWRIGSIRIKQDRWGEVTVSQRNGRTIIQASPTARKAIVQSASFNLSIDCYSKNYFTVRKDLCRVICGLNGLTGYCRGQRAALDRNGKLVLF